MKHRVDALIDVVGWLLAAALAAGAVCWARALRDLAKPQRRSTRDRTGAR